MESTSAFGELPDRGIGREHLITAEELSQSGLREQSKQSHGEGGEERRQPARPQPTSWRSMASTGEGKNLKEGNCDGRKKTTTTDLIAHSARSFCFLYGSMEKKPEWSRERTNIPRKEQHKETTYVSFQDSAAEDRGTREELWDPEQILFVEDSDVNEILEKMKEVFREEIGELKGYVHKIRMNTGAVAVKHNVRKVPIVVREEASGMLKDMIREGAQQTEKAIIRQGAEESSCKQVCCQIEDPARSHQAGQDSVRLSSDIEFQQLDPRAFQKQIAAMKILEGF
ncbi:hypothetical protein NDU88_001753 [Pleurodeles waltl]|uniref:Uncharacterized protein n=1 Tax=Pleurodeles waltl TaxID=8319 RepID=A0AAV7UVK5_PLEWA|nr:hypothetical protein NDU88_001753 [Pleurodeles waltl]